MRDSSFHEHGRKFMETIQLAAEHLEDREVDHSEVWYCSVLGSLITHMVLGKIVEIIITLMNPLSRFHIYKKLLE